MINEMKLNKGGFMKTYTVTQRGGYQVLRTLDKARAEAKLKELQEHVKEKDTWYICEQGER